MLLICTHLLLSTSTLIKQKYVFPPDDPRLERNLSDVTDGYDIRGGSRIPGKGVHMYKCVGFALLIDSIFSYINHKSENNFISSS